MKVCAYIMLHYGSEYLDAAIKSIEPCVEKIFIIYTRKPSHNHSTDMECPDKDWQLKFIALNSSPKVEWHEYESFAYEGQHRDEIYKLAGGYDICVTVDSDEVWDTDTLKLSIEEASKMDNTHIQIDGFIHFWKSFNHVCRDWFHPVRILNLNGTNKVQGCVRSTIYHFGYAQREDIMRYKLSCHGHKSEFREGWLENTYLNWKDGVNDVHPVSIGLWNPESFDKATLPEILKNHENYNKEEIK